MSRYDQLKSQIDEYSKLPNVKENNETISVNTLYKLLKERFSLLSDPYFTKDFVSKINRNAVINNIGKDHLGVCKSISFNANLANSEITLAFNNLVKKGWNCYKNLLKDYNSEIIYSKNNTTPDKFIKKHYKKLMEIFTMLEYFADLLQGDIKKSQNFPPEVFTDNFLSATISYNMINGIEAKLNIVNDSYIDLTTRRMIEQYLQQKQDILLSKMPAQIKTLNPISKKIIAEEYLHTLEHPAILSFKK